MKRVLLLVVLLLSFISFANIDSISGKLPADSQSVLVLENLKENYDKSKKIVLMDMVLNQLAIEQLVANYVEMLAYNNGLDPEDIYKAFEGDMALSLWKDLAGQDRLIVVLGPMENPKALKASIEKLLPQLLPMDTKLEMATDQQYLYVGDLDQYYAALKGFDTTSLKSDLPEGFGYFYSLMDDSLQKGSMMIKEDRLLIEGLSIPLSQEGKDSFQRIFSADVRELEAGKHLPLLSLLVKLNDFASATDLASDQLTALPLDIESLGLGNLNAEDIQEYLTGDFLIDVDLSVDSIFANLMGSPGTTEDASPAMDITYIVRVGYTGTLELLQASIEKTDSDVKVRRDGDTLLVEGQYVWQENGWLYLSSINKEKTARALSNGAPLEASNTYVELSDAVGKSGFIKLFVDTGYVLTGLMGVEIQSGILLNGEYSAESGGMRFSLIVK